MNRMIFVWLLGYSVVVVGGGGGETTVVLVVAFPMTTRSDRKSNNVNETDHVVWIIRTMIPWMDRWLCCMCMFYIVLPMSTSTNDCCSVFEQDRRSAVGNSDRYEVFLVARDTEIA